jgi:hypothetical protein
VQVDATYAYVAASASLWRVPLAGGAVETLATTCSTASCYNGAAQAQNLVVDDTSVYFPAKDGSLRSMPKSGGTSVAVTTAGFRGGAVDASFVYGVDLSGTYPAVAKVPKGGGATITLVPGNNEWLPVDVALDGTTLYWNQILTGQVFNGDNNQLLSIPVSGGATTLIYQQPPSNAWSQLNVQSGYAAWLTNDDGTTLLEGCTVSGTSVPFTEGGEQATSSALAFDGATLFVAITILGPRGPAFSIQPITGAAPTVLNAGGTQVWGLATDATNVYIGLDSYLLKRAK